MHDPGALNPSVAQIVRAGGIAPILAAADVALPEGIEGRPIRQVGLLRGFGEHIRDHAHYQRRDACSKVRPLPRRLNLWGLGTIANHRRNMLWLLAAASPQPATREPRRRGPDASPVE